MTVVGLLGMMLSMQSVLGLYKEDQWDKPVS
jgi:hypothetical protein